MRFKERLDFKINSSCNWIHYFLYVFSVFYLYRERLCFGTNITVAARLNLSAKISLYKIYRHIDFWHRRKGMIR